MRKFLFAAVAAVALAVAANPGEARASWLSQLIRSYIAPGYYYPAYPVVPYTAPYTPLYGYMPPAYGYAPWMGYYNVPYYAPYRAYRYYGRPWYGGVANYHEWREWHRNPWHEWREHHWR
jgi:hypothetical protein